MGRPRKSYPALRLAGTATRSDRRAIRPSDDRRVKPKGDRLGAPPRHLDTEHREVWREIGRLAPEGVLTRSDRVLVEQLVRLVVKMRHDLMTAAEVGHLRQCLGAIGLTPSSREQLTLQHPEVHNDDPYNF